MSFRLIFFIASCILIYSTTFSQEFATIPRDFFHTAPPLSFGEILPAANGRVLIGSSKELYEADAMVVHFACAYPPPTDEKGNLQFLGKNSNIYKDLFESIPGIKLLCEGPDSVIYVVTNNNNIGWINYKLNGCISYPPFNFQDKEHKKVITRMWVNSEGILFIATDTDVIYYVEDATKVPGQNTKDKRFEYKYGLDKDSNYLVTSGARPIRHFSLGAGIIPYSFSNDPGNERIIIIGTNNGLYGYDKRTDNSTNYFKSVKDGKCTITNIEPDNAGFIFWLSTLEKGMAKFNLMSNSLEFFRYPKKNANEYSEYPINTFTRKSENEFFVAVADSLPAIFNTDTGRYSFITDTVFHQTENVTTDIKVDGLGYIYLSKGGGIYFGKMSTFGYSPIDTSLRGPFINDIMIGNENYRSRYGYYDRIESLKEITLKYNENDLSVFYACRGINSDSLVVAWKIDNYGNNWVEKGYSPFGDYTNTVRLSELSPGKYTLRIRAKKINSDWLQKEAVLIISIQAPYWRTWWFWAAIAAGLFSIIYLIVNWRVNTVRKKERARAASEREILELEAKALRAQMNPHFIFNCLNSIKAVIQKDEKDKAVNYLTTFSKLIRTIFQNSDKREITLFDELETCRLYVELESMRFGSKLSFTFSVDETIDLKSSMVPALIIQPFIENAVWHGLIPKLEGGRLEVSVTRDDDNIYCIVEDNGIGRKVSMQNKSAIGPEHDSRGVRLTQTRLELSNSINQRNATVEIVDKSNEFNEPAGTKVILSFSIG